MYVCSIKAQTNSVLNYQVHTLTSLSLTSFDDLNKLRDDNKIRLSPFKQEIAYEVNYVGNTLYKIKQTHLKNDYINKGMCLPINTMYANKILSEYCGRMETSPTQVNDLSAFEPQNYVGLFNYFVDQSLFDSLNGLGFSIEYYNDYTLHFWNDSNHFFINKDKFTYNELYINEEGIPNEEKFLFKKVNGKIYQHLIVNTHFENLDSGVVGIAEDKQTFFYNTSEGEERMANITTEVNFPSLDVNTKILYSKTFKEHEGVRNNTILTDACDDFKLLGLYDVYGKNIKIAEIKNLAEVYNLGLSSGMYFIKYTCNNKNFGKSVVITNN